MAHLPFRQPSRSNSRQASTDPHNEINVHSDYYVGTFMPLSESPKLLLRHWWDRNILGLFESRARVKLPQLGHKG